MGLKPIGDFPSGPRPCHLGLPSLVFGPNHRLCLVWGFSMPRWTPPAPFLKPSLTDTYVAYESIKPRVEPSPTLRFTTQATTGVTPRWSRLGSQLNEPPHSTVYPEGHVTLSHFKDVNFLVDVYLGWPPLVLRPTFLLTLLMELATCRLKKPICIVSLCFQRRRFNWMCLLFSSSAFI